MVVHGGGKVVVWWWELREKSLEREKVFREWETNKIRYEGEREQHIK